MMKRAHKLVVHLTIVFLVLDNLDGATTQGSRERESDGAFSPRDTHHHGSDGSHNTRFDHEAILGSQKEAKEFQNLSPNQSRIRLMELASKMDRNKDGVVSRMELNQWILRSFRMLAKENADEEFVLYDTDEDGYVTWEEYKKENYDTEEDLDSKKRLTVEELEDLAAMREEKILFNAADINGDSRLSNDEFLMFDSPEAFPEVMRKPILDMTFKNKDKNGDRKIDFKEFVGERAKDQNKEWLVGEKERFDEDLDSNSDGFLDENEVYAWIVPSDEDIAGDEVDHLFASSDDNHDEVLSFDEIKSHYDIFVGSRATDYGEQLESVHKFEDEL